MQPPKLFIYTIKFPESIPVLFPHQFNRLPTHRMLSYIPRILLASESKVSESVLVDGATVSIIVGVNVFFQELIVDMSDVFLVFDVRDKRRSDLQAFELEPVDVVEPRMGPAQRLKYAKKVKRLT